MFEFNRRLQVRFWKNSRVQWVRSILGKWPVQIPFGREPEPLTERQQEALVYMTHFACSTGWPAGLRDVALGLDCQPQAAFEIVRALEKRGLVGGTAYAKRHKALLIAGYEKAVGAHANGHHFVLHELSIACSVCGAAEGDPAFLEPCTRKENRG